MFDDVPLDTRHHKVVTKPKFPLEWRMSEERRKVLSAYRMHSFYIDQAKVGQGQLVDGKERVAQAHAQLAAAANQMPRELLSERVARAGALFRRPIKTRR